eukprot:7389982-Prymnesium_polylepis.1
MKDAGTVAVAAGMPIDGRAGHLSAFRAMTCRASSRDLAFSTSVFLASALSRWNSRIEIAFSYWKSEHALR